MSLASAHTPPPPVAHCLLWLLNSPHRMQPSILPLPSSHVVLRSTDHVRLIAAFLHTDELLHASSLCRASRAEFDGEAVWQSRLRAAQAIQHVAADVAVPASAVLSAAQLAALPPLPSVAEIASLCLQSFVETEKKYDLRPESSLGSCRRLTALLRLPSTVRYHARIVTPRSSKRLVHNVAHVDFALSFDKRQRTWKVRRMGGNKRYSGLGAINMEDNVGQESDTGEEQPQSIVSSTSVSSKQRYIELLQCSEHVHNGCHRLLPPAPPRPVVYYAHYRPVPPLVALPVCGSCRTAIARCIQRTHHDANEYPAQFKLRGVTRINRSTYESFITDGHGAFSFRDNVVHTAQQPQHASSEEKAVNVGGYSVVLHHGAATDVYVHENNVCDWCQCGLTRSSKGHSADCDREERERERGNKKRRLT